MQTFILALIAALGALIAYLQWVTAHQKIVLELFDKRFAALQALLETLGPLYADGKISTKEFFQFAYAMERCRFLFGADVFQYLETIKKDLSFLVAFTDEAIDQNPERNKLIDKKAAVLTRVADFNKDAVPKFMPYMHLDQRMKYFWPFGR